MVQPPTILLHCAVRWLLFLHLRHSFFTYKKRAFGKDDLKIPGSCRLCFTYFEVRCGKDLNIRKAGHPPPKYRLKKKSTNQSDVRTAEVQVGFPTQQKQHIPPKLPARIDNNHLGLSLKGLATEKTMAETCRSYIRLHFSNVVLRCPFLLDGLVKICRYLHP